LERLQHTLLLLIKTTFIFVVLSTLAYAFTSSNTNSANITLEAADARIELSELTAPFLLHEVAAAPLPEEPIKPRDNRSIVLENYLRNRGSYLANHTDLIVELSDYYGVNPKLIVAMAGVESGYCRINFRPYNCWGYGRYSWSSPEDGIRSYMSHMNAGYFSKGARTIEGIASPYNPWPDHYVQKVYIHYNMMPRL
jgi:Mannosyl-glycoprotein endo-beta-N-acetylglucosaminidase